MPAKRKRTTKGGKRARKRTTKVARSGKPVGLRSKGKSRKGARSFKKVRRTAGGRGHRLTKGGSGRKGWTLGGIITLSNLGAGRAAATAGQNLWLPVSAANNDPSAAQGNTCLLPPEELGAIWENLPVSNNSENIVNVIPAAANWQHPDRFYIHSARVKLCSLIGTSFTPGARSLMI